LLRKRRRIISSSEDADPLSYSINIVDCMLVLAVGFMLFAIMSMNMQNVIFGNLSPEERAKVADSVKNTIPIEQGQEIDQPLDNASTGSDEGYSELGKVYEDPTTGKMVMVPN